MKAETTHGGLRPLAPPGNADEGDADAQFNLGVMYARGVGVAAPT